jgi:hypothetical protein
VVATWSNGLAIDGGGVGVGVGRLELHGVVVAKSEALDLGGGLWVGPNGYALLDDTVVETSRATSGGAVAVEGQLDATGGSFASSQATNGGGLWVAVGAFVSLDRVALAENTASVGAGARIEGGFVTLADDAISDNVASLDGGGLALSVALGDQVKLTGVVVTSNSAGRDGGGLFATVDGTLTVDGASLGSNTASRHGGDLAARLTGDLDLTSTSLSDGHAAGAGGALWVTGGRLWATDVSVTTSVAGARGSGAWLGYGEVHFDGVWVLSNVSDAATPGGGLYLERGWLKAVGGGIGDNGGALVDGGGIYADLATTILEDVLVDGNTGRLGGGLYAAGSSDAPLVIVGETQIRDNVATWGGGLYLASGDASCGEDLPERRVGFLANRAPSPDHGPAMFLAGTGLSSRFDAYACDFGATGSADDNVVASPAGFEDVFVENLALSSSFEDDETLTCTPSAGCF